MIFDLSISFKRSGDTAQQSPFFHNELCEVLPVYNSVNGKYFSAVHGSVSVAGYYRRNLDDSVFADDKVVLYVIGECYSRTDSVGKTGQRGRLTAKHIAVLYAKYGRELMMLVKGSYQLIVYSLNSNSLEVINNKTGISPLYYYSDNKTFLAATAIYLFPKVIRSGISISDARILEQIIFNYPLANNTLYREVSNLLPGEIVFADGKEVSNIIYFNITDLLTNKRLSRKETIEKGSALFREIIGELTGDHKKIISSLTGGFDGRTILAFLNTSEKDYRFYAFGIEGSINISIPQEMSLKYKLDFHPYYLDDTYSGKFPFYAKMTTLVTDCLATFQRANYAYVLEKLSEHSDVVLTGIFGSELLRTFQNAGLMISENAVAALLSENPVAEIRNRINNYQFKRMWKDTVFADESVDEVINNFTRNYLNRDYSFINQFVFTYFLKDALRKYFGGEVHSERLFVTNRYPFFDDEFIELSLQSPFSAINNTFMSPSVRERFTSQQFYAHLLKSVKPELLEDPTDHGFAPKYLLYPFSIFFVGIQAFLHSRRKKKLNYREFNDTEWSLSLLNNERGLLNGDSPVNASEINRLFEEGELVSHLPELKQIFSVLMYNNFMKCR